MMKKILFSCMIAALAGNSNAQVLFTQDFNSSTNIADYVRTLTTSPVIALGDNMVAYADKVNAASTVASVTINDGKLRLHRTGTSVAPNPNNHYSMAVSRTALGGGGQAVLASPAPSVLKISCDLTVSGFNQAMTNVAIFQIGGNGLHNQGFSNLFGETPCHSAFGITTTTDRYRFSRPNDWGQEGNTLDVDNVNYPANYPAGSTQQLTWFINNSGNNISSYTGPDGNSYSLANDTWDLFVGNTRILAGRSAISSDETINNFSLGVRAIAVNASLPNNAVTIDIDNLVMTDITNTLPVSLTTFTGITVAAGNLLKWQTASEQSNSHFEVLRSTDGKEFTQIDRVEGKGTTTDVTNYQFTDYNPAPGVNYYKLKQVDFDGNSAESQVVAINPLGTKENISVIAKDNQVEVHFFAEKAGAAQVTIHDISGRKLLSKETSVEVGGNVLSCPVNLAPGIYVGSVSTGGKVAQAKFQK